MFAYWLLKLLLSTFVRGILVFIFPLIQFRPKVQELTTCNAVLDCRMRCVQLFYGISLQCTTTRSLQRKMKERTSQQNTHIFFTPNHHMWLRFIFRSTSSFGGFKSTATICATGALACDRPAGDATEAAAGATAAPLSPTQSSG